jgi:hypothetical protein
MKMAEFRSKEWIQALPSTDLRAIVRSTNPNGALSEQRLWAKAELQRRHNNNVHRQWQCMEVI